MCGRFSITGDLDFYAEYFAVDEVVTEALEKSWNVAPTDNVYVVTEKEGTRRLGSMNWGLLPHWAKDTRSIHINARSETVATNNTFRDAFIRHRCLIPADGFYEWGPVGGDRRPHWIYRADGHPIVFAGIWSARREHDTGEWQRTCAILTRDAEGFVGRIHDRMPIGLPQDVWGRWLDRKLEDPEQARALLTSGSGEELMGHIVSKAVNTVRNNTPDLRDPVEPDTLF